jgi:3'-phosphoadenosine 5'-phosphosulfate sulfotransferase (PAPS reductase)/FAD synthetase
MRDLRKKLLISFSGGRTSGYMTKKLIDEYSNEYDIKVVFANTGFENEETLEFVFMCDSVFNFGTVWLEAVTNPEKRQGTRHKEVTYFTASRNGEPFEQMIQKYGLSNIQSPHCTRELKLRPIDSYVKSIGWDKWDYDTAIGIRTDEIRRVRDDKTRSIVYPLVDWFPSDKQDVLDWWEDQQFDLRLQEHQGNCKTCWKKSFKKLIQLHNEKPEQFDFFERMERQYGRVGAEFDKCPDAPDRVFFRGRTSVPMLRQMAQESVVRVAPIVDIYADGGCSESCELYETVVNDA